MGAMDSCQKTMNSIWVSMMIVQIIDAVQNKSDLKDFVGIWVLDSVATNKNNDRSLSFMYGSGLTQYGADFRN